MESEASEHKSYKPSYVLIAVDTHASMFKREGAPSCFKNCLKALYRLSDHLILKSDKRGWSPFSVVLCEKDEKATFVNFQDNMIETTKLLKKQSALTEEQLKAEYMRDHDVDLAAFFQLCKKKFKNINTDFYKRIMIFITNNPDPNNGDANKRYTALNETKNFGENDIIFELIVPDENFKFNIFYDELFSKLKHSCLEIICEDEEGLYIKLSTTIWFRHTQRKLSFYPFPDDTSKFLSVYYKSYLNHERLLNNSSVAKDGTPTKTIYINSNEEVPNKGEYRLINKDTKFIIPDAIFPVTEKWEIAGKLNEYPIGLTLLYVSNRLTEVGEVIGDPQILEADSREELKFFNEFWEFCVNENKVMICARNLRKGARPRAVELIPKRFNNNKVFIVQQIPFADEICISNEPSETEEIFTNRDIEVTNKLIENMKVSFSSELFVDVEYVRKKNYVKSKLLDEPRDENESPSVVTQDDIDAKLEETIEEYLECFPPDQGKKRKVNS